MGGLNLWRGTRVKTILSRDKETLEAVIKPSWRWVSQVICRNLETTWIRARAMLSNQDKTMNETRNGKKCKIYRKRRKLWNEMCRVIKQKCLLRRARIFGFHSDGFSQQSFPSAQMFLHPFSSLFSTCPRANAGFSLQIVAPLKTTLIYSNYNTVSVSVHTAQVALCKVRWPFIQKLKSQNQFTCDKKILIIFILIFFPFENVNILPATLDGMVDSVALNVFEYLKGLWKKEVEEKAGPSLATTHKWPKVFFPRESNADENKFLFHNNSPVPHSEWDGVVREYKKRRANFLRAHISPKLLRPTDNAHIFINIFFLFCSLHSIQR